MDSADVIQWVFIMTMASVGLICTLCMAYSEYRQYKFARDYPYLYRIGEDAKFDASHQRCVVHGRYAYDDGHGARYRVRFWNITTGRLDEQQVFEDELRHWDT